MALKGTKKGGLKEALRENGIKFSQGAASLLLQVMEKKEDLKEVHRLISEVQNEQIIDELLDLLLFLEKYEKSKVEQG